MGRKTRYAKVHLGCKQNAVKLFVQLVERLLMQTSRRVAVLATGVAGYAIVLDCFLNEISHGTSCILDAVEWVSWEIENMTFFYLNLPITQTGF